MGNHFILSSYDKLLLALFGESKDSWVITEVGTISQEIQLYLKKHKHIKGLENSSTHGLLPRLNIR